MARIQMDAVILLGNGEIKFTLHPDGRATIALQSEGEGGREIAKVEGITHGELKALCTQAGRFAAEGRAREPRPEGCAVEQGMAAHRCRVGGALACRCALELHGI